MKRYFFYLIIIIGIVIIGLAGWVMYIIHSNSKNVIIIEHAESFNRIEQVLQLNSFRNKVVLIDLWGVHCAPCLKEFSHISPLKERYKNKPVEFLYLAVRYSEIADEFLWKKMISNKKLYGYHLLMSNQLANNLWATIEKSEDDRYVIPRYLITGRDGKILYSNAERPHTMEKLYQQIDSALNK
jgi:thiol-disulfide isomerase/thioredoxin